MTLSKINVLVGQADWAWNKAVKNIFAPRGISPMVAADADDALKIIERGNIHMAIVDMDSERISGLGIIKVIRGCYPLLPCILVAGSVEQKLLSKALQLNVFSVIAKPVDMIILQDHLNRLFIKKYSCSVFGEFSNS